MATSTELKLVNDNQIQVSEQINAIVSQVTDNRMVGVVKMYAIATAIEKIDAMLTPEFMAPIMKLQGKEIGFRTDLDKTGGYTVEKVKDCVMAALLLGLQPYGNQFNIIQGKMYPTKEGFRGLLGDIKELWFDLIQKLPVINDGQALCKTIIEWKIGNGEKQVREIELFVKVNNGMGTDAILGKAERKACKWLYGKITGNQLVDGDANEVIAETNLTATPASTDAPKQKDNSQHQEAEVIHEPVQDQDTKTQEPETISPNQEQVDKFLEGAKNIESLEKRWTNSIAKYPDINDKKYQELKSKLQ